MGPILSIDAACNEFFYLPSKHFDIKKNANYYNLIPKHGELPKGIRIEKGYLRPVILSPRDLQNISIQKSKLKRLALMCDKDKRNLRSSSVLEYIKWGEQQKFHQRPSCSTRGLWWNLGDRTFGEVLWPMIHNERPTVFLSNKEIVVDHNLFEILAKDKYLIWASLMAIYQVIIRELYGRANLGEGALKTEGIDIKKFLVIFTSDTNPVKINIIKIAEWFYQSRIKGHSPQYSDKYIGWLVQQASKDNEFFKKARRKYKEAQSE